ncbi:MAG: protein kinase [Planctomycetota bacterium]|nr:protein kinase [Planctomycetota bacterium]
MSLASGSKLAHYEVLAPLGAGAMGEVYRALDTRLGREIAIKVLPEHFAGDEERLRRFEREARTLASLNHPNVAQIFGVECVGELYFLVLELVPGESLDERLRRGPLPVEDALDVARQIAEGLEAAHDAGVIHRDLKPANVRLTPEGKVKVLDFGLAKPTNEQDKGSKTDSVLSTEAGRLLGTPTYMAPEQARGKAIDKRVDIWAFGCVLYECLTARRAFAGETLTDVLGAVLHSEAELTALPPTTPRRVRELLESCFAKDPRKRLRDVGQARLELERAAREPRDFAVEALDTTTPARERRAAFLPWTIAGAIALAGGTFPFWSARAGLTSTARPEPARVVRFAVLPPEGSTFSSTLARSSNLALSPAGDRLVFVAEKAGRTFLCVRRFDEAQAVALPDTDGASNPCFSPDGRWLAFQQVSKLVKMPADGGPQQTLCDATSDQGLAWLDSGRVLWGGGSSGLWSVSANGGTAERLVTTGSDVRTVDGATKVLGLVAPVAAPGGRHVLACVWDGPTTENYHIVSVSLEDGSLHTVLRVATEPRFVAPDLLLFTRGSTVMSVAFDAEQCRVVGEPQVALQPVFTDQWSDTACIAATLDGTFAYIEGKRQGAERRLIRFDEAGNALPLLDTLDSYYGTLSISPDGRRAIVTTLRKKLEMWVLDVERRSLSLVTSLGDNYAPIWSSDGSTILAMYTAESGESHLARWRPGGGAPEFLAKFEGEAALPQQELPDGSGLIVRRDDFDATGDGDLVLFRYADTSWTPLRARDADEATGRVSPDGRWLTYSSDESGRTEVYVGPLAPGGENLQISSAGGIQPRFSTDGTRVYFLDPQFTLVRATLSFSGGEVRVSEVTELFNCATAGAPTHQLEFSGFEVLPDGGFAFVKRADWEDRPLQVQVILDWPSELRPAPAGR